MQKEARMPIPYVVFLGGASGAGKSTLVNELSKMHVGSSMAAFLHFDSIGVPSSEEMIATHGSTKEWQRATTYEWIKRIAENYTNKSIVFFEGQTEFTFVKEAFKKNNIQNYTMLLVHAPAEERHRRLVTARNQPHLVNDEMDNWANYLLNQSVNLGCTSINTSTTDVDSCVAFLETFLNGVDKSPKTEDK